MKRPKTWSVKPTQFIADAGAFLDGGDGDTLFSEILRCAGVIGDRGHGRGEVDVQLLALAVLLRDRTGAGEVLAVCEGERFIGLAILLTLIPAGLISLAISIAVASPSILGLVARITSLTSLV